jgi:succinate dehydrogenase / fumarate reductase cytochrome b subunit
MQNSTSRERKVQSNRPKYLNLLEIRQPLPAVVSFLHRVCGALLFFPGIPLLLCGLDMALNSSQDYARLQSFLDNPLVKGLLTLLLWAFLHHFFAGVRFLALDLGYGGALGKARASSKTVLAAGILFTLLISIRLW